MVSSPVAPDLNSIERLIVGAALDSEPCLLAALLTLQPSPFRGHEADLLHAAFYWAADKLNRGCHDDLRNRDSLIDAMVAAEWPPDWCINERRGWVEGLPESNLIYDIPRLQRLCEWHQHQITALDQAVASLQALVAISRDPDLQDAIYLRALDVASRRRQLSRARR